jgi:hypothetical protein
VDAGSHRAREHRPLNLAAVAIQGKPASLMVGGASAEDLVQRLRSHVDPTRNAHPSDQLATPSRRS